MDEGMLIQGRLVDVWILRESILQSVWAFPGPGVRQRKETVQYQLATMMVHVADWYWTHSSHWRNPRASASLHDWTQEQLQMPYSHAAAASYRIPWRMAADPNLAKSQLRIPFLRLPYGHLPMSGDCGGLILFMRHPKQSFPSNFYMCRAITYAPA